MLRRRVAALKSALLFNCYAHICRGLFERHKLLCAFLITVAVCREDGALTEDQWQFFLHGPKREARRASSLKRCPSFIPGSKYHGLQELEELDPSMGVVGVCQGPLQWALCVWEWQGNVVQSV